MDYVTLTLLAHLSAHRRLLINLYTCRLLGEADPLEQTLALREAFMRAPTHAPEDGSGLDPVTSDMLAAMTDETIDDIMVRVLGRVRESCGAAGPDTGAAGGVAATDRKPSLFAAKRG